MDLPGALPGRMQFAVAVVEVRVAVHKKEDRAKEGRRREEGMGAADRWSLHPRPRCLYRFFVPARERTKSAAKTPSPH